MDSIPNNFFKKGEFGNESALFLSCVAIIFSNGHKDKGITRYVQQSKLEKVDQRTSCIHVLVLLTCQQSWRMAINMCTFPIPKFLQFRNFFAIFRRPPIFPPA